MKKSFLSLKLLKFMSWLAFWTAMIISGKAGYKYFGMWLDDGVMAPGISARNLLNEFQTNLLNLLLIAFLVSIAVSGVRYSINYHRIESVPPSHIFSPVTKVVRAFVSLWGIIGVTLLITYNLVFETYYGISLVVLILITYLLRKFSAWLTQQTLARQLTPLVTAIRDGLPLEQVDGVSIESVQEVSELALVNKRDSKYSVTISVLRAFPLYETVEVNALPAPVN